MYQPLKANIYSIVKDKFQSKHGSNIDSISKGSFYVKNLTGVGAGVVI